MSSFYTRFTPGGRQGQATRRKRRAGRRTGSLKQTHNGTAGWIWQSVAPRVVVVVTGREAEDRRADGTGRRGGREEERDDQFQLIGNFSPINRTGGGAAVGSKVKSQ